MKVLAVTGIRSEYDILYPVIDELRKNGADVTIAVSGAHLSDQQGNTYQRIKEDGFEIADCIDTLFSTDRLVQRPKAVAQLVLGLTQTVDRLDPDFLLVIGDREESIATAIVGNYMDKLVVHIGGGDPVYGNADDPVRFAVSKLAHVHCCTAKPYAENLLKVGEEDFRVFWTGNPAYVNISQTEQLDLQGLSDYLDVDISNGRYIVLIKHPLSSEMSEAKQQMEITLSALDVFCRKHDYKTIIIPPNTDPGSNDLRNVISQYESSDFLHSVKTLPRVQFVNLIRNTRALAGNSSMGILEAPFYKLPVVNIGHRQQGRLNAGNVEFVAHDKEDIVTSLEKACFDEEYRIHISNLINPYGDETAAIKIRKVIESIDLLDKRWYTKEKLC